MRACESVAVVVSTIRNTGALDHTWSAAGTRSEVVEQARSWQSRLGGSGPEPAVAELVAGLPPAPDDGPWLTATGSTVGQLWVWVTSTDGADQA